MNTPLAATILGTLFLVDALFLLRRFWLRRNWYILSAAVTRFYLGAIYFGLVISRIQLSSPEEWITLVRSGLILMECTAIAIHVLELRHEHR